MQERVNIINHTAGGGYFLEGRARIVRRLGSDLALVDFDDGYGMVQRFVDPQAQGDDVDAYIAGLNAAADPKAS